MHHPQHNQPSGDGPDSTEQILTTVRARLKRAATAARWLARSTTIIAELRAELAALREEVVMWRRMAARRANLDPDMPPPPDHYIDALRTVQRDAYQAIVVDIDGLPWTIGLSRHRQTGIDPMRELTSWQLNVSTAREVRACLAVEA